MDTHSRIRKFRVPGVLPKTQVEFEIGHEYQGHNDFFTYMWATHIGPRGGRGKALMLFDSVTGQDYEWAARVLIKKLCTNFDRVIGQIAVQQALGVRSNRVQDIW